MTKSKSIIENGHIVKKQKVDPRTPKQANERKLTAKEREMAALTTFRTAGDIKISKKASDKASYALTGAMSSNAAGSEKVSKGLIDMANVVFTPLGENVSRSDRRKK